MASEYPDTLGMRAVPRLVRRVSEGFVAVSLDRRYWEWRSLGQCIEEVGGRVRVQRVDDVGMDKDRVAADRTEKAGLFADFGQRHGRQRHDVRLADGLAPAQLLGAASRDSADAAALEAAVQRRSAEFGDQWLQPRQRIVEREARVFPEDDDQRFVGGAERGRGWVFGPHRRVVGRFPSPPFVDGLWIEPEGHGELSTGLVPSSLNFASNFQRRPIAGVSFARHVASSAESSSLWDKV